MIARCKSAAGTGKQDEKETASGTESRTESRAVCTMAQTTALKAGSLADSILELCFKESLGKIVSVSILFCSRKARQPEGSCLFSQHSPSPPASLLHIEHRLQLCFATSMYSEGHLFEAGES